MLIKHKQLTHWHTRWPPSLNRLPYKWKIKQTGGQSRRRPRPLTGSPPWLSSPVFLFFHLYGSHFKVGSHLRQQWVTDTPVRGRGGVWWLSQWTTCRWIIQPATSQRDGHGWLRLCLFRMPLLAEEQLAASNSRPGCEELSPLLQRHLLHVSLNKE